MKEGKEARGSRLLRVLVLNVILSQVMTRVSQALTLDAYGGRTDIKCASATGVFHLEKISNRWWVCTPSGNALFMNGAFVFDYGQADATYNSKILAKYGSIVPGWTVQNLTRYGAWGFNVIGEYATTHILPTTTDNSYPLDSNGIHSTPIKYPFFIKARAGYYAMKNTPIPTSNIVAIDQPLKSLMSGLSPYYNNYVNPNGVPDYFDPRLQTYLDADLANNYAWKAVLNSPYKSYVVGVDGDDSDQLWGFGAGPDFPTVPAGHNGPHMAWVIATQSPVQTADAVFKALFANDTKVYTKAAWHDYLVGKYGTISALNAAWGSTYTTFDSSGQQITGEPVGTGDGTTAAFTHTLAQLPVSHYSVQLLVNGKVMSGDTKSGAWLGNGVTGTINYTSGQVTITFSSAPASGAVITMNYQANAWGYGSGIMDEDGRTAHQAWLGGTDLSTMVGANPNTLADLDAFLQQMSAKYFGTFKAEFNKYVPGVPFMADEIGSWQAPARAAVLKGAAPYVDVIVMPAASGAGFSQAMMDFMFANFGDKPLYEANYRTANADSDMSAYSDANVNGYPTQAARGQDFYNGMANEIAQSYSNGSHPFIGSFWWQYIDNWGERLDWGLISHLDNAYDGHEAVAAATPCSAPLQSYSCGGEPANYGDGITPVKAANALWLSITSSGTVAVDTTPPTVAITSPANGAAVSGTVTVSGTAADKVTVTSVQVSVDGGMFQNASGTSNWTFSLNTTSLTNASHTISAKATDTSGNISTVASITVSVVNVAQQLAPVITSALTASGNAGSAFSYQITASNSPASFSATGLPAGLSVDTSNGLISGTPTVAGTSNITLSATNAGGTGTAILALTVASPSSNGATINAATCSTSDVQAAINSASGGDTVTIPACPSGVSWTSGATISGKGITVQGAGAGRVIAVDVEPTALSIGTGVKTFSHVVNDQGATAYLNATPPQIAVGQTIRIIELGFLANFMEGTVSSFNGSTLVMNITSAGGTCGTIVTNAMNSNCKRWMISTIPGTVLTNNLTSGAMFTITEDASVHTTITGIHFAQGSGGGGVGNNLYLSRNNPSGVAILIHDNFFESQKADLIDGNTSRGVIWNNSFVFSPFSQGQWAALRTKDANNTAMPSSWMTPSTMGSADTTGQNNLYFETNDIHADGNSTDLDDNSRTVVRYNVFDHAGAGTHGADTSFIGIRYFEYYNNVGLFQGYTDGTTPNMNWWMFVRGGTFLWHDNVLPALSSQDWGDKPDLDLTVMSLQRKDNYACWGSGFTSPGQYYPAPRQIGFGYITGGGKVNWPAGGYNGVSTTSNSSDYSGSAYVGDSEPAYLWGNNRTMTLGVQDYGLNNGATSCPSSPTPDSSAYYFVSGRDYFNGSTPKPGYTPYTYPHPLVSGAPPPPAAPAITSALSASATVGSTFSYQITASNNPTSFNAAGLPTGLSVNTTNGLISGTPTSTGISSVTISATNAGGTGPASLLLTINSNVIVPVLTSIVLSPATASVSIGAMQQFAAVAKDQNGNVMSGVVFSYLSSNPSVTTVNSSGLATGVAAGSASIIASSGSVTSNVAFLTVNDTTPPTTSIVSPAAGATVSGTITVTVLASDDVGVAKVQLLLDSILIGTDTAAPYVFSWDTRSTPNGSHTLTARAYDAAGNVGSASVTVNVKNKHIRLSVTAAPANGFSLASLGTLLPNVSQAVFVVSVDTALEPTFPVAASLVVGAALASGPKTMTVLQLRNRPNVWTAQLPLSTFGSQDLTALSQSSVTVTVSSQVFDAAGYNDLIEPGLGGTIQDPSGVAQVSVAGQAVATEMQVLLSSVAVLPTTPIMKPLGGTFNVTTASAVFVPMTLVLAYNQSLVPSGVSPQGAAGLAYYSPATGWTQVNGAQASGGLVQAQVTQPGLYAAVLLTPSSIPGLHDSYVYPNPALPGQDPVIRAELGLVDTVNVTIFDVSGRVVFSGSMPGGTATGIVNGQYYYDYPWAGGKASGVYFAVVHGKASDGTIVKARAKFAVIR